MPPVELWESFFDPAGVVGTLAGAGMHGDVVEFGCGYGTFTIAMASRTAGTLYALDIDPLMVSATANRVAGARLSNVIVEQRDFVIDGSGRETESMGFAMLFNILHLEDPLSLLGEAHRVLRRDGRVGITHWRHDAVTPRGPPLEIRPKPAECRAWGERAGFVCVWEGGLPGSPWHWGMVLQKR